MEYKRTELRSIYVGILGSRPSLLTQQRKTFEQWKQTFVPCRMQQPAPHTDFKAENEPIFSLGTLSEMYVQALVSCTDCMAHLRHKLCGSGPGELRFSIVPYQQQLLSERSTSTTYGTFPKATFREGSTEVSSPSTWLVNAATRERDRHQSPGTVILDSMTNYPRTNPESKNEVWFMGNDTPMTVDALRKMSYTKRRIGN